MPSLCDVSEVQDVIPLELLLEVFLRHYRRQGTTAQGRPASVQIYTKTGLRRPFPSRWPREAPPPYKSIRKVASGAHFPAVGPGRARQRTNLYQNWPPGGVSQHMARGSPATLQSYTKCGLWGSFPSRRPRGAPQRISCRKDVNKKCRHIQLFKYR